MEECQSAAFRDLNLVRKAVVAHSLEAISDFDDNVNNKILPEMQTMFIVTCSNFVKEMYR
jgi:hypothetical protein